MTARWRGHSHPELYTMINSGPGAAASDPQTQYWTSLTEELGHIDADLNKALTELKATWQGDASESANTGMTPLQAWATDAQSGSSVMGVSTQDQADFISKARAEMPPPVEVTTPAPSVWDMATAGAALLTGNPGPAAAVAGQAVDHEHQEHAQDAAAQKAVDTMNTYESNSTWNRNTLGTFVPPPDVVVATPPPAGMTTGGVVGGWNSGAGNYRGGSQTTSSSHVTAPPSTGDGGYRPPLPVGTGNGPGPGGGTGGPGGGYTPPQQTGTTTPAGFPPFGGGDPDSLSHRPGTGPTFPGGPNFPGGSDPEALAGRGPTGTGGFGPEGGRGGTGAFGPGSGGSGGDAGRPAAQLGRGPAGGLGAAGGEGGMFGRGGAGVAGGAGARGGGAMGGPMGAGGHGEGDEDQEHFSPDYLMETNDVFGDDRMVSPSVIGENPMPDEK